MPKATATSTRPTLWVMRGVKSRYQASVRQPLRNRRCSGLLGQQNSRTQKEAATNPTTRRNRKAVSRATDTTTHPRKFGEGLPQTKTAGP